MSTNLDKSLDEILAARPRKGGRRGGASTVGGINKKQRPTRASAAKANASITENTSKAAAKASANKGTASKIIVSNLPYDVSENMIKEYFGKVVGPVKTCLLTYGPDGRSRGVATITFNHIGDAEKAALSYNGVLVDKRPMKVELVLEPKAPGLETRIGAPNKATQQNTRQAAKPKPATSAPKSSNNNNNSSARGRGGKRGRGGRPGGRPKPKTAEELDAEMADYWDGGIAPSTAAPAVSAPAAPTGGDTMDEIL